MNPKIYIAILHQGTINTNLAKVIFKITTGHYETILIDSAIKPIENNRSFIVNQFLETDCTHLLMIDEDIVPHKNPLDMITHDKDIIGAACPQWRENDIYWVAVDKVETSYRPIPPERRGGLKQIDAVGTGCILIKRNVLEKIKLPFKNKWNKKGELKAGEDFNFCDKAKRAGFEVWIDWNIICSHYKTIDLLALANLLGRK